MSDNETLPPEPPLPPSSSLFGRMANVIAAPGELFAELKAAPVSAANWLVPTLLVVVLSWISVTVIFSQENINQQLRDIQEQAIRKRAEKAHMSQQQIEQTIQATEKFAAIGVKIGGYVAPPFAAFGGLFLVALVIWLVGTKVHHGAFGYLKAVEVVGLAQVIACLGVIVKTLLIVALGNIFASPSPVLLLKHYDPQSTLHAALGMLDVTGLWSLAVMSAGFARLAGISFGRAAAWLYGIWLLLVIGILGFNAAMRAAFGG